jgi:HJR/Mrr/RecB family endonuclease
MIVLLIAAVSAFGWVAGIVITLVVGVLMTWFRDLALRPHTPTARELSAKLENINSMTGGQFEVFIAELLRAQGYQATVLGGSGDQGVDIIAVTGSRRIAIQCKNYKKPVGNRPVQEVYTGARHYGCQQRWVVAPAGFTTGAVELARSVGVLLFDANSIRAWIQRADQRASEQEQEAIHPTA